MNADCYLFENPKARSYCGPDEGLRAKRNHPDGTKYCVCVSEVSVSMQILTNACEVVAYTMKVASVP